jgi:peptidoglycan/xylan/chitin deacetylase (PgdA/CDA1 family)
MGGIYAIRSVRVPSQLSDLQAEVNAAAAHGGGWVQIILYRVCSQTYDPGNYTSCLNSNRPVQLDTVNGFLDWLQNAGQPGGAPAGATLNTTRNVVTGADATAPTTTISCNGAACQASVYNTAVSVTFSATDTGSGAASTHYTTDGSTPTLSSPTYTGAFTITSTTTVKFRSWDNAGNAEATKTQLIQANPPPDTTPPVTTIACNASACTTTPYNGSVTVSLTATDNAGGWGVDKTYYTTDGSTPTTSSTVYAGAFQLSSTATVQFFSTDLAGNAEPVQTQQVQVQPPATVVSLTFDDGDQSQYTLAFQRALQPHGMRGTFYVNTGHTSNPDYAGFMTWSDLADMSGNGQEIGGHTVDHIDLTSSSYTQQQKTDQVCNDRQALIDHGLSPISFAYPYGSYDANAESIVQGCGYTTARRTGGLPLSGAPYAETIPPADRYATRAWTAPTPTTSPIQLSDLQAGVTNAASHGGGWLTIVIHQVCSQAYDPGNYSACLADFRPIELDTFNAFLDWLQNSAPPGTSVKTVGQVMGG